MKLKIVIPYKEDASLQDVKRIATEKKEVLRPFYPSSYNIELTASYDEADAVFVLPLSSSLLTYEYAKQMSDFKKYGKKFVFYINDDEPNWVYDKTECIKLVAQPCHGIKQNIRNYIEVIPLMMTDQLQLSDDFINECRHTPKKYNYCFIGDTTVHHRKVFGQLKLDRYLFRDTTGFHLYSIQNKQEKLERMKSFLKEIASAEFVFCPRGVGSSSFRLYETLMVGSVPIVTGMNQFPFKLDENVSWGRFAVRGPTTLTVDSIQESIKQLDYIRTGDRYPTMRYTGIDFWEKYCKQQSLNDYIIKNYVCNS